MNARVFIKAIWDKIENRYKGKTKLLFSANRNNCSIMPSKRYIIVGLAFVKVMEIKWGDMSDEESKTHPSHRQRIKYAKIGRFDNGLIQIICNDNGYKESKELYCMYDDIRLE